MLDQPVAGGIGALLAVGLWMLTDDLGVQRGREGVGPPVRQQRTLGTLERKTDEARVAFGGGHTGRAVATSVSRGMRGRRCRDRI